MSMLDTLGGAAGGLGGSGGVGGSIPSNSSAANSAATNTINPSISLGGNVGGGYFELGPFNPMFPGAQSQPADAINRPFALSSIIPNGTTGIVLVVLAVGLLAFALYKRS